MSQNPEKLAIDGGTPARSGPFGPWPHYAEDEIEAVSALLRSGKVNQWTGSTVGDFQKGLAETFGVPYAIAVANGTLSLELALRAFGIGPGDDVIVTPRSFIASACCVSMVGARPVFADIEIDTQNISARTIEAALTPNTKAIIPVHLGGVACDMVAIMALADARGLIVIEDCAQSHGGMLNGQHLGSFGHAGSWSFCQDKVMSTGGEGGAILFKDQEVWKRAWAFKDHGKSYDTVFHKDHPPGFRWLHESIGTNWRMTGMQAAIGLKQLEKLGDWHAARTANGERLSRAFGRFGSIEVAHIPEGSVHAYYRLTARAVPEKLNEGWDRDRLMAALNAEGLPTFSGACTAVYHEKAFDDLTDPRPDCPNAEALGAQSLAFLTHPTLDEAFMAGAEKAIEKVLGVATR